MTGLSEQQLAEIAARAEVATPGPWCTDEWEIYQGTWYVAGAEWIGETCRADDSAGARADAAFIAAARTDVPALLAEVASFRADLEPFEMLTGQQCAKGIHPDWLVDSEHNHACPWCRIAELEAERHSTNEALSKADEAIRANESRWSAAENAIERAYRKGYDPDAAELAELLGTTEAWDAR